jgi:hypothetical protein
LATNPFLAATEVDWEKYCESILREKDEVATIGLIMKFVYCSPKALAKGLLLKLAEDPRERVAVTACQALVLRGADEEDARRFWKIHDRIKNPWGKASLVECIGLTGDLGSVKRLCEIVATEEPELKPNEAAYQEWEAWHAWVGSAQRSAYLLTSQPKKRIDADSKNAGERKELSEMVSTFADWLLKLNREERSRTLMDAFIHRGLTGPWRETAEYGLLRLAGRFPLDWSFFSIDSRAEYDEETRTRYTATWRAWWVANKDRARWDDNEGRFVTPETSPPGLFDYVMRLNSEEAFRKHITELKEKEKGAGE